MRTDPGKVKQQRVEGGNARAHRGPLPVQQDENEGGQHQEERAEEPDERRADEHQDAADERPDAEPEDDLEHALPADVAGEDRKHQASEEARRNEHRGAEAHELRTHLTLLL